MSKYQSQKCRVSVKKNFRKTGVSSAIIGLAGSMLCFVSVKTLASDECGLATAGGGIIDCTASGNSYNNGIQYSGLTGTQTINFDGQTSGIMTLNKVAVAPNNGVDITGTGNQTYNVLGTVNMTIDGRGGNPGIHGMYLVAAGAGNTLTFNANSADTNFNLTVYGAGPDSLPGLTGIHMKAETVNADLSKSNITVEGGNAEAIDIITTVTDTVNSVNLKTGNITIKSHSTNFPDHDAAVEIRAKEDITVDTTAGTINITESSLLGASKGLIGVRATSESNSAEVKITSGNINIHTDNGVGVSAQRTSAAGAGKIKINTVAGSAIQLFGRESIGLEINNSSGESSLTALGSVIASGEKSAGIVALNQNNGAMTINVGTGVSIQGGWTNVPLADGAYTNHTPNAAVGILLGANGDIATVNNSGFIGAGSDRAIESLETAAGLTDTTTYINNSGTITGTIKLGSGDDILDNTGLFELRGLADITGNGVRDEMRIAVTDFGAGTNNQIHNSGTLSLVGNNGQATILNNAGEYVTGYAANTMTLGGTTQGQILNVQTFNNSGVIDMSGTAGLAGDVLIISGGVTPGISGGGIYISENGSLTLDTMLNEGDVNSASDMLVVDGTLLGSTGATSINISNTGGLGAKTVGDGIELVRVLDNSRSEAGVFKLGSRVVAGIHEYDLFQHGIGAHAGNGNWYLRTLTAPPPETGIYLNNLTTGSMMFMHTLHDRLGEPQYTDRYKGEKDTGVWGRIVGNHTDSKQAAGTVKIDTNTSLLHVGGDLARWYDDNNNFWLFGLMGAYGHSKSDARGTPLYTQSGYKRTATGKIDGYSVGAYATWYGNEDKPTGPYVDAWALFGWYENKVQGNTFKEESYNSKGWTASVEAGYAFIAHDGQQRQWMIEPQAQIAYNAYSIDNHYYNGTHVYNSDADGVITRLGARLYQRSKLDNNGIQPFVEANWWYSNAKNSLHFNDTVLDNGTPKSRYELKAGLQGEITEKWQLWGHIGAQLGSDSYRRYEGMVGVKYLF